MHKVLRQLINREIKHMKKISFNQDWTFQKGTGGIFAMISGASGEA